MINIVNGNILNATEDIICHQVNCKGVMGSGLAKQIKDKYPECYQAYKEFLRIYEPTEALGKSQIVTCKNGKLIANIFGQLNYGTNKQYTNYSALQNGLDSVANAITNIEKYKNNTVAIPYGIGCGLGGGDWDIVQKIIKEIFEFYGCDVTIYKLV
jgi:O-acetyl-ADP-ribose deacetylase (regulator of RNase III)